MPIFVVLVLVFIFALYMAYRSWGKLKSGKRVLAMLLLLPNFLLILCFGLNLSCGSAAQGSACFNQQFLTGVFAVFVLPLPSLVGTLAALRIFMTAR
jgi:hypothetical protein